MWTLATLQRPLGLDTDVVGEDISIKQHLDYFKALHDAKRQALDRLILRAREEQATLANRSNAVTPYLSPPKSSFVIRELSLQQVRYMILKSTPIETDCELQCTVARRKPLLPQRESSTMFSYLSIRLCIDI